MKIEIDDDSGIDVVARFLADDWYRVSTDEPLMEEDAVYNERYLKALAVVLRAYTVDEGQPWWRDETAPQCDDEEFVPLDQHTVDSLKAALEDEPVPVEIPLETIERLVIVTLRRALYD